MNYSQSLHYLDRFYNLERITLRPENRLHNLDRMRILLNWFGHPERHFFPILIAGTKGKGSTGFLLEAILKASGIRTGFYHSPHLETPRERIRIQGKMISSRLWAEELTQIEKVLRRHVLPDSKGTFTYFEILTLMAIRVFARSGVRIGIFEIGLGGRLDATNILPAQLALVTPISYDHEQFLGHTLRAIAREKAGIIHPSSYALTALQAPEALKVLRQTARRRKAVLKIVSPLRTSSLGLTGDYQKQNAALAAAAAKLLKSRWDFPVTTRAIQQGLQAHDWPGRWETLCRSPKLMIDGAHNPASIEALVRTVRQKGICPQDVLLFGTSRDKNHSKMLEQLGQVYQTVILTRVPYARSQDISVMLPSAKKHFARIFPVPDVREAVELAKRLAGRRGRILATGSFYVIGAVRQLVKKDRSLKTSNHKVFR